MKRTMEQTEESLMEITQSIPAVQRQAVLEQWKDEVIKTAKGTIFVYMFVYHTELCNSKVDMK